MPNEIERRFLVAHDGWKQQWVSRERLRDGLVLAEAGRKLRVRICDSGATLCVKGKRRGNMRAEYEYPIPMPDAEALLREHCDGRIVEKTRYAIPVGQRTWVVDVYHGLLEGILIAEIELDDDSSPLQLPDWIGEEVTDQDAYRKSKLFYARSFISKMGAS